MLILLPGVGNIGKAALDALNSTNDAIEIARLHHTALPPLAVLDEDGLLSPPHLSVRAIEMKDDDWLITITGSSQPLEPNNQGLMAREILQLLKEHQINDLVVLAGMVDDALSKEILLSQAAVRIGLI